MNLVDLFVGFLDSIEQFYYMYMESKLEDILLRLSRDTKPLYITHLHTLMLPPFLPSFNLKLTQMSYSHLKPRQTHNASNPSQTGAGNADEAMVYGGRRRRRRRKAHNEKRKSDGKKC